MGNNFNYNYNKYGGKKRKCFSFFKDIQDIGFVLIVFGIITVCAFFLPPKAWILLLGIVLVVCGIQLFRH